MKIQHLAIVFVMVMVPIILVITSYIQTQIDTISLQTTYNTKLQTATMDSIKAFQLNSINNKYSTVSDSKIRDIEASISTFFNSIGTELGASGYSKEDLQNFIPAMLYTMYDGYYIYGEFYNEALPVIDEATGLQKVENGELVYGDYQYGLKPYIYYSCRYKNNDTDVIVNYTLDNNITIYGTVNGQFETRTGPLIDPSLVDIMENATGRPTYEYVDGVGIRHVIPYVRNVKYGKTGNQVIIEPEVLKEQLFTEDDYNNAGLDENLNSRYRIENYYYDYVIFDNNKIYMDKDEHGNSVRRYFKYENNKKKYISDAKTLAFANVMTWSDAGDGKEELHSNSAATYYYDAYIFSTWVKNNLGDIKQIHACEVDGTPITKVSDNGTTVTAFDISTGDERIFNFGNDNNPLLEDSTFNENRICVIRRSIQSNLAAAIANFGSIMDYEYVLPIFTEEDWDKIVNNISVTAFMQGMPIGAKYYNNYYVITNDKNKEVVTKDSIYILAKEGSPDPNTIPTQIDEQSCVAHFPTCMDMINNNLRAVQGYRNIDFEKQTVVSEFFSNDVNFYPHANERDYECVVSARKYI